MPRRTALPPEGIRKKRKRLCQRCRCFTQEDPHCDDHEQQDATVPDGGGITLDALTSASDAAPD
jgi:hypothetical protein